MMHRVVGLGLGLLFLLVQVGCGDTGTPPPSLGAGGIGTGGGGDEPCADEGGPTVTILLPVGATDPNNADLIVTDPNLTVDCAVAATGGQIDGSSVTIRVTDSAEETLTPSVVDNGDGTYSGAVDLSALPNGSLTVVCEASDSAATSLCSSATVSTFLDLGPGVEVISPSDNSVQGGGMTIEFAFTPLPLSDGDTNAELSAGSSLVVAGASIPTSDWVVDGYNGSATVDFDDPALYATPLNGDYEFTVSATNLRGVTREVTYGFTVDAGGPTINIVEPKLASIVAGATSVLAEITDPSGVNSTTVRFRIDAQEFSMVQLPGTDQYTGSFDANQYPSTIGQVTINVTAADLEGNDRTQSVSVQLDSIAPLIDMDPPLVREAQEKNDGIICSTEFDPVGSEAANDQTVLSNKIYFRTRIHDRTNRVSSISGINNADIQVYILDDHTQALLIDTDGDKVCDSVNPDFLPNNSMGNPPAVVIDMTPVAPTGAAFYPPLPTGSYWPSPYDSFPYCFGGDNDNGTGTSDSPPDHICSETALTRVIPDNFDPGFARPTIFGRSPLDGFRCIGDRFDFLGAGITPGNACVVARVTDNGGNEGVSSPLRVCLDDNLGDSDCITGIGGTFTPDPEFTCTDGCTHNLLDYPPDERIGPPSN